MSGLLEIKALFDEQGKKWELFRQANDERLKALESQHHAPVELVEKVEKIDTDLTADSKRLSELMQRVEMSRRSGGTEGKILTPEQMAYKGAMTRFLRSAGQDASGFQAPEVKAMVRENDASGGYLVTEEMDAAIGRTMDTMTNVYGICNSVTIGGGKWSKMVRIAGMDIQWVDEGATATETTPPQFSRVEVEPGTAVVYPRITYEMLEDESIDPEQFLAEEAGIAYGVGIGAAIIAGSGVKRPRGFISGYTPVANASYAWGSVGYVASGKSAAFASSAPADKLVDLVHALDSRYRNGARFVMGNTTLSALRQLKDGSGRYYLWSPDPNAGFGGTYLGFPVTLDDNVPAIGAGSFSIAFGDFMRAYTVVERLGITVLRDPYTTEGHVKFRFRRRIGGDITNFEALKLMKFAAS